MNTQGFDPEVLNLLMSRKSTSKSELEKLDPRIRNIIMVYFEAGFMAAKEQNVEEMRRSFKAGMEYAFDEDPFVEAPDFTEFMSKPSAPPSQVIKEGQDPISKIFERNDKNILIWKG